MIVTMMDRAKIRPGFTCQQHSCHSRLCSDRQTAKCWMKPHMSHNIQSHTKQKYQERNFTCYWRQFAHKHTRLLSDNYASAVLGLATGPSSPWFWVIALESLYKCERQRETNDKLFMHSDTRINGGDSQPFRAKKQKRFELDNRVYTHIHTRLIRVESEYHRARNLKAREKVR